MAGAEENFGHKNLKAGDIVVWSTKIGDAFEEAVAILSGDEMTHAGLVSRRDISVVIEQVPGGTTTNPYPWHRQGRTVYVMRLESLKDLGPVLRVAEASLKAKDPLSWKNLLTLAILLLLKQPHLLYTHNKAIRDGFITFFRGAAQDPSTETPNSAYCSEFVYDRYEKAGSKYKLDLDRVLDKQSDEAVEKLFQKIVKHVQTDSAGSGSEPPKKKLKKSHPSKLKEPEDHHKSLLKAVKAAKQHRHVRARLRKSSRRISEEEIDQELAAAILDFARASLKAADPKDQPDKDLSPVELALYALDHLKTKANLVTPGDLTRIKNDDATMVGTFVN